MIAGMLTLSSELQSQTYLKRKGIHSSPCCAEYRSLIVGNLIVDGEVPLDDRIVCKCIKEIGGKRKGFGEDAFETKIKVRVTGIFPGTALLESDGLTKHAMEQCVFEERLVRCLQTKTWSELERGRYVLSECVRPEKSAPKIVHEISGATTAS